MEDLVAKKLIRSKSGFRMVSVNEEQMSPLFIQEPLWKPDKEATKCTNCSVKFGFTTRKHHCRRCGLIYCSKCCEHMLELPRMCFIDPVRVCINCESETLQEKKFFQHDLKLLTVGALFLMKNGKTSDLLMHCKLSQDHRSLVFEGSNINPINLYEITHLSVEKDISSGKTSLEINFNDDGNQEKMIFGTTKDAQERKTGSSWIKAIKQAYRFSSEGYKRIGEPNSLSSSISH